jgi:transketolase
LRDAVIKELASMADADGRIVLLCADLGFGVLESFSSRHPARFVNVGIAEQNMAAVAAGMALEGCMAAMYSIGNFPTLRCLEQVRNDICCHNANVKIIAVGGGFAYGTLGVTHHATEDIAAMRALPGMRVFAPADSREAVMCAREACRVDGPAYIRLARGREPDVSASGCTDVLRVRPDGDLGRQVVVLTTGTALSEGLKLRGILAKAGISAGIASVPCVKPIDEDSIRALAKTAELVVTMEDHNIIGGLGSAVAEIVSGMAGRRASVRRVGLRDTFAKAAGSQEYLRGQYGISAAAVAPLVGSWLAEARL